MPKVEKTGIYRNADGHGYFLRKDAIASDEVLDGRSLDEDAELSPTQAAVIEAEGAGVAVAAFGDGDGEPVAGPFAPGSIESAPSSNDPSESRELTTASYPADADPVESEPAPVAPGGRRKRRKVETPEDAAPPVETPEGDDGKTYSEDRDGEDAG